MPFFVLFMPFFWLDLMRFSAVISGLICGVFRRRFRAWFRAVFGGDFGLDLSRFSAAILDLI